MAMHAMKNGSGRPGRHLECFENRASRHWQRLFLHGFLLCLAGSDLAAQTLVSSAGTSATLPTGSISWSMGEPIIGTAIVPGGVVTQGFQQPGVVKVRLRLGAILEGPYASATGLMNDALRSTGVLPLSEPYSALGYAFEGGGGETTTAPVLAVVGSDAIVDWVVVELRDPIDPTVIVASRSALLQRDGDIVELDGVSPVGISASAGDYHIAVRHRNHLAVMSASPYALDAVPNVINFSLAGTPAYGTNARKSITGTFPALVLWAGDVTFNGQVKYAGGGNDRDP
ncbi:MAG TPA: hypothetical protein PKE21_17030, partial [Flavobacteriales bacterium]|nr:hypothetical protein [Flavobacteriales bacterium]HMR29183.1 hypothetical protein [Flavobacteriales bacterium]